MFVVFCSTFLIYTLTSNYICLRSGHVSFHSSLRVQS